MTSKRIKKKKTSFVALLLLFKNIEKEVSKNKQYPKHTTSSSFGGYLQERERNKQTRRDELSFHKSFSCEKKIPLSRAEKTQQTTSEKEKEKKRQNKQTTDFFFSRRKHFTPILEDSFIRKKSEYSCSLLLRSRRDRGCFFQEEILETINKHRKSWALSCRVWLEH